jgi:hypothetical protein
MSCKLLVCVPLVFCTALHASAATTQPSAITLHAKNVPTRQLFEDLARQSGAAIPPAPPDLFDRTVPPVSIDLERQAFWAAVKQLGQSTGIEPSLDADDPYPRMRWGLGPGFWEEPHTLAGPLAVFVNDVSRSATVELARTTHRVDRDVTIELTGFVEPGLRVVSISPAPALLAASDENGRALTALPLNDPEEAPASQLADQPGTRVWTWNMMLRLSCPEDAGKRIARLRARTTVRVATTVQPLEFLDVLKLKGATRPVGSAHLTFRNLMKADIEYVLRISLRRDKTPPEQWDVLAHSIYNGMFALYDDKGRVVADRCTENGFDYTPAKIDATLRFVREPGASHPQAGEPHKLVWEAPTAVKDLPVEFELLDLPIPK